MVDPAEVVGLRQAIRYSAEVEVQLTATRGAAPLLAVLFRARAAAASAMASLVDVDPETPAEIRRLQNDVKRFRDLVGFVSAIAAAGMEADELLEQYGEDEREEIVQMVAGDLIRGDELPTAETQEGGVYAPEQG